MKEASQPEDKRPRAACPEEAGFVDLLRTTDMLSRGLIQVLKTEDLSATQYNVLRILRGAPAGLACGEIAIRMITRDPDVTRLLDRLEKRDLVERTRSKQDRRVVCGKITPAGLKLLREMDSPLERFGRAALRHVGQDKLQQLIDLLELVRSGGQE